MDASNLEIGANMTNQPHSSSLSSVLGYTDKYFLGSGDQHLGA